MLWLRRDWCAGLNMLPSMPPLLPPGGDASSLSHENRALRAELQKLRDEKERLSREVRR